MNNTATRFVILYAEDDLDDLYLVQDCFKAHTHLIEILHAEDGVEAISALQHLQNKEIQPCLILLDMNMPRMNGKEALIKIKSNKDFKEIPVVMFTTSSSHADREFARKWGADFITKPLRYDEIHGLATELVERCNKEMLRVMDNVEKR